MQGLFDFSRCGKRAAEEKIRSTKSETRRKEEEHENTKERKIEKEVFFRLSFFRVFLILGFPACAALFDGRTYEKP